MRLLATAERLLPGGATALRTSARHQLLIDYIEQARLAMSGNSASGAFGTGPASGYSLIYIFAIYIYVIVTNACCVKTMDHAPVNIIMFVMICLIFWIKINSKISLIPTAKRDLGHDCCFFFITDMIVVSTYSSQPIKC